MGKFPSIPTRIPEGEQGSVKIEHFEIGKPTARMMIRPDEYISPGRYARLLVNNNIMMSDTPMERQTNNTFLRCAHGDILIAGLGLGMILFPLLEDPEKTKEVKSIVVIEKNPDVFDLVLPHLPDDTRLAVFQDDIFTWKPKPGWKFNTIYFDIWKDITTDNLPGMAKLHRRFARSLDRSDPRAFMDSWCRDSLRARRRRELVQERENSYWREILRRRST